MRSARRRRLSILGLVVGLVVACGDENPLRPEPPDPTLENIWPNEDGRSWTYLLTARLWDPALFPTPPVLYDSASLVPPATLDHAESLLASNPAPDSIPSQATGVYRLVFDGLGTTRSGACGQRLRGDLFPAPPDTARRAASGAAGFWNHLERARPDLRSKIDRIAGPRPLGGVSMGDVLWVPLLLRADTAWVKTSSYIGSYGDIDTRVAWWYLTASLSPREEFVFQLVPCLTNDVFLRCRVLRRFTASTEVGRFENAIECLYVIDYGVSESLAEKGRFFRAFDYGTVTYAPTVGPIGCYERSFVFAGPANPGVGDQRLDLLGTGAPVPPE